MEINNLLSFYFTHNCGQKMKNVSLHLFLLFLQIFFTSGEGSHVGDLIRTKSGKVFLRRSSKKAISPKKDAKEGGQHDSDDKESKVTKIALKKCFLALFLVKH